MKFFAAMATSLGAKTTFGRRPGTLAPKPAVGASAGQQGSKVQQMKDVQSRERADKVGGTTNPALISADRRLGRVDRHTFAYIPFAA